MKKKRRTKKVAFSIRSKLLLLLSVSMVPFLLIAVYLLISIANYNQTYHEIVDRLTIANTYNIQFKEQMDESLYKVVVGYVSMVRYSKAAIIPKAGSPMHCFFLL